MCKIPLDPGLSHLVRPLFQRHVILVTNRSRARTPTYASKTLFSPTFETLNRPMRAARVGKPRQPKYPPFLTNPAANSCLDYAFYRSICNSNSRNLNYVAYSLQSCIAAPGFNSGIRYHMPGRQLGTSIPSSPLFCRSFHLYGNSFATPRDSRIVTQPNSLWDCEPNLLFFRLTC